MIEANRAFLFLKELWFLQIQLAMNDSKGSRT